MNNVITPVSLYTSTVLVIFSENSLSKKISKISKTLFPLFLEKKKKKESLAGILHSIIIPNMMPHVLRTWLKVLRESNSMFLIDFPFPP